MFETSRAYLLLSKCIVAASAVSDPKGSASGGERRIVFAEAIGYLKKAWAGFKTMEAHHRVKDVLYMMARLYHAVDMIHERNQVSAEFKAVDDQYPTNVTSRLAQTL